MDRVIKKVEVKDKVRGWRTKAISPELKSNRINFEIQISGR
jgi:hypothetical protein